MNETTKISVSKLDVKTVVLLVVLMAAAALSGQSLNVSVNLQNQVNTLQDMLEHPINSTFYGLQQPTDLVISVVQSGASTYYCIQNGTTGAFVWYSTNKTAVQEAAIGNLTGGGSIYLKGQTFDVSLSYPSNVLVIEDYYGELCYFGDVSAVGFNATTIYCTTIDALTSSGTKVLKLVVENGTSFPASPVDRQVFFRSDVGYLYVHNNSVWVQLGTTLYSNLTGTPDLTVYLNKDGATALMGDWNIGGSYGVYGATWLNSTQVNALGFFLNGQQLGFVQPCSFVIDQNVTSGYYQAWHGSNSTLFESSTNASAVINNAIGNLTSGGNIFLASGLFNLSIKIYVTISNIRIVGSGKSTIIVPPAGDYAFHFQNTVNCRVADLCIDGTTEPTGQGIRFQTVSYSTIQNIRCNTLGWGLEIGYGDYNHVENVDVIGGTGAGINVWQENQLSIFASNCIGNGQGCLNFAGGSTGCKAKGCYLDVATAFHGVAYIQDASSGCTFEDCTFTGSSDSGIDLRGNNNTIAGCTITGMVANGIEISNYENQPSCDNIIVNNHIFSNGNNGILLETPATGAVVRNIIHDNIIESNSGYGISETNVSGYTSIKDNIFNSNSLGGVSVVSSNSIVKHNVGFVTENSVSGANTTATTAVINHGLASTATYVWCSFNTSAILSYTWTSTTTQITITVTGTLPASWTVYAKVEYVP